MNDPKQTLRIEARRHRARQPVSYEDYEQACEHFFETLAPAADKIIAAYMPQGREFDPLPILERAAEQDIQGALPVVEKDTRILRFAPYKQGDELRKGAYGIAEPVNQESLAPDIIIVPLLSFDRRGYRLGQGGGYYDATLEHWRAQKEIVAVGIGYAGQACLFPLPVDDHDHKMDYIITPGGAQKF